MKVTFFVEGNADQKFLIDYLLYLGYNGISERDFVRIDGNTKANINNREEEFLRSQEKGKKNILIFDADKNATGTRRYLEEVKTKLGIKFELFLFPNDLDPGNLETLLEQIINPDHESLFDCFEHYRECLKQKNNPSYKIPDSKTKVFAYLDALLLKKEDEKLAKEGNRDYRNTEHWNLNSLRLEPLKNFLQTHLNK